MTRVDTRYGRAILALIVSYWLAWLYTEVSEHFERADRWEEVQEYISDTEALRERIERLEKFHGIHDD